MQFYGINFSDKNPMDYLEGKQVLKLLMQQIREHQELESIYKLAIYHPGRASITKEDSLWDFIPFISENKNAEFTAHLHYTISITSKYAEGMITIPNGIKGNVRKNFFNLPKHVLLEVIADCAEKAGRVFSLGRGAQPVIQLVQRRYPSQRGAPIMDGSLIFDIRTLAGISGVKKQPEWLGAMHELISNKNSNLQFQAGMRFYYKDYPPLKNAAGYLEFIKTLEVYESFLDILMKS